MFQLRSLLGSFVCISLVSACSIDKPAAPPARPQAPTSTAAPSPALAPPPPPAEEQTLVELQHNAQEAKPIEDSFAAIEEMPARTKDYEPILKFHLL